MSFDIEKVISEMTSAIKGTVGENWDEMKTTTGQFLQNRKNRLELLAQLRISGEISEEKFKSRLEDEKLIAEAELNALAVISKAIAQRAANAAIDVLEKAVKTSFSSVL